MSGSEDAAGRDTATSRRRERETRILEERARVLAKVEEETVNDEQILQLVTFPLAGERYGIEADMVQEVQPLDSQRWSLVPCTPDFIVGAVNIRGRIHSVMDVAVLLGLPRRPLAQPSYVLLVRSGDGEDGMELCILADGVPEMAHVRQADVKRDTATVSSGTEKYISGVTEDMLIVLDLKRLLADERIIVHEEV